MKSKDFPIMEFFSANNAYQNVALLGFRTFYQGNRNGAGWGKSDESFLVEPFDVARTRFSPFTSQLKRYPTRTMFIGPNEMQIQEVDHEHRIETNVTYFTLPEENFGAFARRTTISNVDKDSPVHLSLILDGLARIQPVGGKINGLLKNMGRTLEGWMGVYDANHGSMPFFRLSTEPADSAAVVIEEAGHFVLSYIEGNENNLLPIVYDTNKVFGQDSSLLRPVGLYEKTVDEILDGEQYGSAKTSSAFSAARDVTIYPGQSITIVSFYGRANAITGKVFRFLYHPLQPYTLNSYDCQTIDCTLADVPVIARRINQLGFAQYKLFRARELVKQITADVKTATSNKLFDAHVEQMYLDNILRGGLPVVSREPSLLSLVHLDTRTLLIAFLAVAWRY